MIKDYSERLGQDRILLRKMFDEKKQLFLNKFVRSLEEARRIYADNGKAIFKFYTSEILPLHQLVLHASSTDRIKLRQALLKKVVEGNIMFAENMTWKALKSNLKDEEGGL